MYATFDGYRIGWPMGAEKLLVVSVGTGSRDPKMAPANLAMENALKVLDVGDGRLRRSDGNRAAVDVEQPRPPASLIARWVTCAMTRSRRRR